MSESRQPSPLFVDLDGTLIRTDMLHETLLQLVKRSPQDLLRIPFWLLRGRAFMKSKLAERAQPRIDLLPTSAKFLEFLRAERAAGRKLYLATASNELHARAVADHLGIFDGVIASDARENLKGAIKAERCLQLASLFAYAGNESADFEIFAVADESHLVNPTRSALRRTRRYPVSRVWQNEAPMLKTWATALRIHQWTKNLLLFVPMLAAHEYFDVANIGRVALGFVAFSLLASATYVVNDLLDIEADRSHPRKRFRPLAAGALRIRDGVLAAAVLLPLALVLAVLLSPMFLACLAAYLLSTVAYSLYLKHYAVIDVIALAALYTLRIIAGAVLLDLEPSFWLLAFSMFTFFGLALVKRCAELKLMLAGERQRTSGREYSVGDYELMQVFGVNAAFLSVLILAFFIEDSLYSGVYEMPMLLWLTLPAFAYWFCRMWLKTNRMEMHDDPIVFAVKDKGSVATLAFIVAVTLAARFL